MTPYPTLGHDPAPGDPWAVRQVAAALGSVAGDAESVTTRLRRVGAGAGDTVWRGPAADAFHRLLAEVGPDVARLASAHREAQDAMNGYASGLDRAQDLARRAETDAARATGDRDRAVQARRQAAGEAGRHDELVWECRRNITLSQGKRVLFAADPVYQAELLRYEQQTRTVQHRAETAAGHARGREQTARGAETVAATNLRAAQVLGEQARAVRDAAVSSVVAHLDALVPAQQRGNAVSRFLGRADDTLRKVTADPEFHRMLGRLSEAGGILLNIGSVVALVPVPGFQVVGGALLAAGLAFKGAALAGTLLAAAYGKASASDVALRGVDLALGVLTAKAGGVGARGAIRSDGAKAVLRALDYRAAGTKAAGQLGNREEAIARALHVRPKHYFQVSTVINVGGTTAGAVESTRESVKDILSTDPQRPGWSDLAVPVLTTGIGKAGDKLAVPVVTGAVTGTIDGADAAAGGLR